MLWLDFSDFEAVTYKQAKDYIRHKMAAAYKYFYRFFLPGDGRHFSYHKLENALDIIEMKASDEDLEWSLKELALQLRGYETHSRSARLAILIDNMLRLETVAQENGYYEDMRKFLETFVINDVYKYCDVFLQLCDRKEEPTRLSYWDRYIVHYYFTVSPQNIQGGSSQKMIVTKEQQCPFDYSPYVPDEKDWDALIADGRREIEQDKIEKNVSGRNISAWKRNGMPKNFPPTFPCSRPIWASGKSILTRPHTNMPR